MAAWLTFDQGHDGMTWEEILDYAYDGYVVKRCGPDSPENNVGADSGLVTTLD
jgi:hypothetical protein